MSFQDSLAAQPGKGSSYSTCLHDTSLCSTHHANTQSLPHEGCTISCLGLPASHTLKLILHVIVQLLEAGQSCLICIPHSASGRFYHALHCVAERLKVQSHMRLTEVTLLGEQAYRQLQHAASKRACHKGLQFMGRQPPLQRLHQLQPPTDKGASCRCMCQCQQCCDSFNA